MPPKNKGMRACLCCTLLKTPQQFRREGCENCPFLDLQGSMDRVQECTTSTYDGAVALLRPKESWVAKFQRLDTFNVGLYAVRVSGQLPADDIAMLEEKGIPVRGRGDD